MKTCFKCHRSLPLTDFYRHAAMADGYLGKCKTCAKEDVTRNRQKRIDYYRAWDRKRSILPHRIANVKAVIQREREQFPERARARVIAQRAEPRTPDRCSLCHLSGMRLERHHHHGYTGDNAARVIWLCKPCHAVADKLRRLAEQKAT